MEEAEAGTDAMEGQGAGGREAEDSHGHTVPVR